MDFVSYWYHRYFHATNLTWAVHVVHHSSEEFNFSTGFRGPFTERLIGILSGAFLLYVLPVFAGIPLEAAFFGYLVRDLWGFACHTQNVRKLGPLESVFVTPSHHRVHHAMNDGYIDKNYGFVFIVWDKLFGTFAPEQDENPVIFGVRKPPRSWNILTLCFEELLVVAKASVRTARWQDKIKVWVMPPGWLPKDIDSSQTTINDPRNYQKYSNGELSWRQRVLANIQIALTVLGAVQLGLTASDHSPIMNSAYFLLILVNTLVTGFTLERSRLSLIFDALKSAMVVVCVILGTWFGRNVFDPVSLSLIVLSILASILLYLERRQGQMPTMSSINS